MDSHETLSQLEAMHRDAFGWAVNCCMGDWHRGEDVLQAAYVKVARGGARFEARSALKTWWFGVIRMTAFEDSRRVRSWFTFLDRWRAEPVTEEAAPEIDAGDGDLMALHGALRALSERQREVLHLVFYQRLSLSEAAEVMRTSVGSVRQHYDRGKRRLREMLQNQRAPHE